MFWACQKDWIGPVSNKICISKNIRLEQFSRFLHNLGIVAPKRDPVKRCFTRILLSRSQKTCAPPFGGAQAREKYEILLGWAMGSLPSVALRENILDGSQVRNIAQPAWANTGVIAITIVMVDGGVNIPPMACGTTKMTHIT